MQRCSFCKGVELDLGHIHSSTFLVQLLFFSCFIQIWISVSRAFAVKLHLLDVCYWNKEVLSFVFFFIIYFYTFEISHKIQVTIAVLPFVLIGLVFVASSSWIALNWCHMASKISNLQTGKSKALIGLLFLAFSFFTEKSYGILNCSSPLTSTQTKANTLYFQFFLY